MKNEPGRPRTLREIEEEVMAEGREWTRQRLQQRLQEEADRHGEISPLSEQPIVHRRHRRMQLRTVVGVVELKVLYGQDPRHGSWGSPIRERWGLTSHQQLSLALEDKLAFTLTATGSYEEAAAVAGKWGASISPAALHALAQRLGRRAEEQTQDQLQRAPVERQPERPATQLGVLMIDGWMVRHRGPGWGKQRSKNPQVEWHEWKTGVYYRGEQCGRTQGDRGILTEKIVVGGKGEPAEFGQRLHWQALRAGLGRCRQTLVVADGATWIWNLVQDRWAHAVQLLDFYHASQHLWELGRALKGSDEARVAAWVEPRRHQLRDGQEQKVLKDLARVTVPVGEARAIVQREQNYFATHSQRMNYRTVHRRGWPIGSGPVESVCRQRQCRFKRPGQFWTTLGLRHLAALAEARCNGYWDNLWTH